MWSKFKKITKINNPGFWGVCSMNPYIINAMIEDGRLTEEKNLTEEPTADFLWEHLVRKEATIALEKLKK